MIITEIFVIDCPLTININQLIDIDCSGPEFEYLVGGEPNITPSP